MEDTLYMIVPLTICKILPAAHFIIYHKSNSVIDRFSNPRFLSLVLDDLVTLWETFPESDSRWSKSPAYHYSLCTNRRKNDLELKLI